MNPISSPLKVPPPIGIHEHFSSMEDPRIKKKIRHKLDDIIVITICAAICSADDWVAVEAYGKAKYDWLKTFLELPNGLPSHDKSSNKSAIHMVSAWASENMITIGQVKTEEKSNEITAIPELLNLLEIKGCIVTIDAMGCQKKIVKKIVTDKKADYVIALKGNQGNLHDDVKLFFEEALKNNFDSIDFDFHETVDGDHGRIETRKYYIVSDIDWLDGKKDWKNLNTIGMVISKRDTGDKISEEARYFIGSIPEDAKLFAKSVREHWGIENKVHWVQRYCF